MHIGGIHDVRSRTGFRALYDACSYIEEVGERITEGRTMGLPHTYISLENIYQILYPDILLTFVR